MKGTDGGASGAPLLSSAVRRLAGKVSILLLLSTGGTPALAQQPFALDGRPFFPVGVVGAPLDLLGGGPGGKPNFQRMFGELSGAGMNVYLPTFQTSETENTSAAAVYDFIPDTCEARRGDPLGGLATLKRSGLAVLFPAFTVVEKTGDLLLDRRLDEGFAAGRLAAVRRCYAGISLFAYQTYDDAPVYQGKGIPLAKLAQLKRLLAAGRHCTTPYVLVIQPTVESLGHVTQADLRAYLSEQLKNNLPPYSTREVADGVGLYSYPVPFSPPATVGPAVEQFLGMQTCGLRPLVVLQGFGMADLKLHPEGRRPTAAETRFMAYQAIVRGAGGIMWWGANAIPSGSETWAAIKSVSGEIRRITPWLVREDSPVRVSASAAEVLMKRGAAAGQHLLIAVNPASTPANITLSLQAPASFRSGRRLFSGQPVPIAAGRISDQLPALGVQVYEVTL